MKRLLAALAFILPLQAPVHAADIRSVSRIAFGLENVLFIADWKTAKIRAVTLQPASDKNDKTFNLLDLSAPIGKTIGAELFTVDDLAVRPGTGEAYVAITYGHDRKAWTGPARSVWPDRWRGCGAISAFGCRADR